MSDDLISREALLKELREIMDEPHNTMFLMGIGAAVSIVEHRETAFDKEKVIDDLENLKNNLIDCNDLCGECLEIECDQCALKKAIEIVEKGGIE